MWTYRALVPHRCISELDSICSGNGLLPIQCQVITWTNVDFLSVGPLGINLSEIQSKIQDFSFMKMHLKMLSAKWRTFCPGEDELILQVLVLNIYKTLNLIITVSADGLAPNGARTSADTVLATKLSMFSLSFFWLSNILCNIILPDDISHNTLNINTLGLRQNFCHVAHNIFKCIFVNENIWIWLEVSLKFVLKVQINNIPALVQIMAWCWPGAKPSSETMMVSLMLHIYVSRPQWDKF